jgi:hypothetical protein
MTIVGKGEVDLFTSQMDLEILLAPLKTVDFFIKNTPGVRSIFGESLISIPVKVTGDYSNPEVKISPTSGVSSSVLNIMKNTLKTPFNIIKPIIPDNKEKE